jgi:hypothetical protein
MRLTTELNGDPAQAGRGQERAGSSRIRADRAGSPAAGRIVRSEVVLKFFPSDFAVAKYLGEEPSTDCFFSMKRHYSTLPVRMPKEMMATLDTDDFKTESL